MEITPICVMAFPEKWEGGPRSLIYPTVPKSNASRVLWEVLKQCNMVHISKIAQRGQSSEPGQRELRAR